jgi:hypothetical protein
LVNGTIEYQIRKIVIDGVPRLIDEKIHLRFVFANRCIKT